MNNTGLSALASCNVSPWGDTAPPAHRPLASGRRDNSVPAAARISRRRDHSTPQTVQHGAHPSSSALPCSLARGPYLPNRPRRRSRPKERQCRWRSARAISCASPAHDQPPRRTRSPAETPDMFTPRCCHLRGASQFADQGGDANRRQSSRSCRVLRDPSPSPRHYRRSPTSHAWSDKRKSRPGAAQPPRPMRKCCSSWMTTDTAAADAHTGTEQTQRNETNRLVSPMVAHGRDPVRQSPT